MLSGDLQMGGSCIQVELARGGFVTNKTISLSLSLRLLEGLDPSSSFKLRTSPPAKSDNKVASYRTVASSM